MMPMPMERKEFVEHIPDPECMFEVVEVLDDDKVRCRPFSARAWMRHVGNPVFDRRDLRTVELFR